MTVTADDVAAARERIADVARPTPVLPSATLSDQLGADVALKAENLQRTGSFKVRGAANKLSALGDALRAPASSRAAPATTPRRSPTPPAPAASRARSSCRDGAPLSKIEGAEALGAKVVDRRRLGDGLPRRRDRARRRRGDDRRAPVRRRGRHRRPGHARPRAARRRPRPREGRRARRRRRAGLAASRSRSSPRARRSRSSACRSTRARRSPAARSPRDAPADDRRRHRREAPRPRSRSRSSSEWLDDVVTVSEEEIAEAIVLLMERAKQVVEGAGAVGVAALMVGTHARRPPTGTTVAVLSGGNVDAGLLAEVARRHETEMGRRLVVLTAHRRPPRRARAAARRRRRRRARTSSRSSTSARASTSTSARPRSSSSSRRAAATTRRAVLDAMRARRATRRASLR